MATYYARKAGNINATDVWAATPSGTAGDFFPSFTNADVLMANSFAVAVNVSATVAEVRNDTTGGATAGGSFTLSNGVTLTANVFAGTVPCVIFSGASPNTATLVGNPTGGSGGGAFGCNNNSTGTLTVTGNPTGGSGSTAFGCNNNSTGTLTVTGNPTGGSGSNAHGCNNASTGTLTVTGNPTGGSSSGAFGCNNNSTGTLTVTGNPTGGSGSSAYGCNNNSTGTLTITGNCTGGSGATANGAQNNSTGTMTVVGTINASEFNYGVGGANRGQVTLLTGPFVASTTFGVHPIGCLAWRWAASLNNQTYITVPTNNLLATRNLVTPDNATNFPAQSDVRSAITYGIGGALTGTCAVPPAGSVALGVPVDATTGTAVLTGSDIANAVWTAATRTLTEGGGISAEDVWTYATREITGGTVDTLTNAPTVPSAEDIASEVRTELTPELTKVSALNTDRLAQVATTNIVGTLLAQANS